MRGLFSRPTRIYADASSSSSTELRTSQRRESYEAEEVADELAERTRRYFAVILREGLLAPLGSAYAPYRRRWSQLLLLLATLEAGYIPLMAAFQIPRDAANSFYIPAPIAIVQWLADILFWVDIGLMFRTTTQPKEPLDETSVVTDKRILARIYLRSTFALDVLAVVPLEFFAFLAVPSATLAAGGFETLTSWHSLCLRCNRMLHAHRVGSYHGRNVLTLSRSRRLLFFWCALPSHQCLLFFYTPFLVLTLPSLPTCQVALRDALPLDRLRVVGHRPRHLPLPRHARHMGLTRFTAVRDEPLLGLNNAVKSAIHHAGDGGPDPIHLIHRRPRRDPIRLLQRGGACDRQRQPGSDARAQQCDRSTQASLQQDQGWWADTADGHQMGGRLRNARAVQERR